MLNVSVILRVNCNGCPNSTKGMNIPLIKPCLLLQISYNSVLNNKDLSQNVSGNTLHVSSNNNHQRYLQASPNQYLLLVGKSLLKCYDRHPP